MSLLIRRSVTILGLALFAFSGSHAFAASAPRIHLSNNWAGYVATDDTYTGVSASWTVPDSTKTDKVISADAAWIGIGGLTDSDLIQTGTQAVIRNGRTEYMAWYELLPDTQQIVPLSIHSGDQIHASIQEITTGYWRITITDQTTNQTYQNTVAYDSSHSSAEWIVERPLAITGDATGYLPLSNFGTVDFTDAAATTQDGTTTSLDDADATPLIMSSTGTRLLATPTAVTNDSFTVSYLSTSQSSRYLRALKRTYIFQRGSNTSSRPKYQEINTSYVIRVIFGDSR